MFGLKQGMEFWVKRKQTKNRDKCLPFFVCSSVTLVSLLVAMSMVSLLPGMGAKKSEHILILYFQLIGLVRHLLQKLFRK